MILYRQSLAVPEQLADEISPSTGGDVQSPGSVNVESIEDQEMVFVKVAQAGQMVLKLYRQLHRLKLVNYTSSNSVPVSQLTGVQRYLSPIPAH